MSNSSRAIDSRAPEQEWQSLFQWIEHNTRIVMKSTRTNPWFEAPLTEEEKKSFVSTIHGWF